MIIEVVADDDHHFLLSYIEGKQKCKQVQNIKKNYHHGSCSWIMNLQFGFCRYIASRICKHLQIFMISEYLMLWV